MLPEELLTPAIPSAAVDRVYRRRVLVHCEACDTRHALGCDCSLTAPDAGRLRALGWVPLANGCWRDPADDTERTASAALRIATRDTARGDLPVTAHDRDMAVLDREGL